MQQQHELLSEYLGLNAYFLTLFSDCILGLNVCFLCLFDQQKITKEQIPGGKCTISYDKLEKT